MGRQVLGFTHVFTGIGKTGGIVVDGVSSDVVKVRIDPGRYILRTEKYRERISSFFSALPEHSIVWMVTEERPVNIEIIDIISESVPEGTLKLAYIFTPKRELVKEEKPEWADSFETVFYDSLWEFLRQDVPLVEAYRRAAETIARAFTYLHANLEGRMLINVDYADFLTVTGGSNVGILRLLDRIDFDWHWGLWDRGLVITLVGDDISLKEAHSVLERFQELLREKDIIWGMVVDGNLKGKAQVLALLVKKWGE